ncbi:HD family hydrolase [Rhabdochlamydiaceae symbiont of Dictyostelium giganteum]|uniref:HD domain-containing protein n=1 Tax=Rhabdochlamydiaceae symbiont of Dictyostelium giganteum TaxID=3342349 RepID=UPI00384B2DB8
MKDCNHDIKSIINFFNISERLKFEPRRIWCSNGMQETVASHTWNLALLLITVAPYLELDFNILEALKLAVVHDLPEAITGDIPFSEIVKNQNLEKIKKLEEIKAIQEITSVLPYNLEEDFCNLWLTYEKKTSIEALIVYSLDKIEAQMQQLKSDVNKWGSEEIILAAWQRMLKASSFNPFLMQLSKYIIHESMEKLKQSDCSFHECLNFQLDDLFSLDLV